MGRARAASCNAVTVVAIMACISWSHSKTNLGSDQGRFVGGAAKEMPVALARVLSHFYGKL